MNYGALERIYQNILLAESEIKIKINVQDLTSDNIFWSASLHLYNSVIKI